jgi:superfamily II DNA or RNA helicase
MLPNYDMVIVDEVHQCKSHELKKIMSLSHAHYKFGFTGTLHINDIDNWNTKAYIGPILKEYPSGLLADQGFISKCNVKAILINYLNKTTGTYRDIKDVIFRNQFRLKFIAELVQSLDHNVLLLVGLLDEGHMLKKCLETYTKKEVVFLSGKDDVDIREEWRQKMMKGNSNIALIATYGIMAQGINIPNLKYMVMASPFKAKIRVLQSIGRTLRKHDDKQEGSFVFDICDQVKFLKKHGEIRHKFYQTEQFNIEVQEVNES